MNWRIISTLVVKDLNLFFKNRFFALVTALGLVFYVIIFYVVPSVVDETLALGIYGAELPAAFVEALEDDGLILHTMASEDALKAAVEAGDYPVGVALPADFMAQLRTGAKPRVQVYVTSDVSEEYLAAYTVMLKELTFMLSGQQLNIEADTEVLGPDMAGQQVPPRNRILPVFALFLLMTESLGLATLIASEVEGGTLRALLVTPLRIEGLFAAKGLMGVGLAFGQVALLVAATGGLRREPGLILTALLLGSLLITGLAFVIASLSKDLMSVMAWGVVAMLLLAVPGLNVMVPGLASDWIKAIPSYYLVDAVHGVINLNLGWSDVGGSLLILAALAAAFFAVGVAGLRRRFQ